MSNPQLLRLFASQRFIEVLNKMEHQISRRLLHDIKYNNEYTISYLDFGNTNDTVSYILGNKFQELIESSYDDWKERVWSEKRTNLKIGKLIKMMYGDEYPINHPKNADTLSVPNDIESFVNIYKSENDKQSTDILFELVNGNDIKYWYNADNYSRYSNEDTTLGRSCMRHSKCRNFLTMYSKNKSIFNLLILKDIDGKLRGRALVWNLKTPENRVFMDRVYGVNDSDVELLVV